MESNLLLWVRDGSLFLQYVDVRLLGIAPGDSASLAKEMASQRMTRGWSGRVGCLASQGTQQPFWFTQFPNSVNYLREIAK